MRHGTASGWLVTSTCGALAALAMSYGHADTKPSDASRTAAPLSIAVKERDLVDGQGRVLHLRGVNLMGLEYTAISGWSPTDPFPQLPGSAWKAMREWKINAVRIPLNEISFLGGRCVSAWTSTPQTQDADPGRNYKQKLKEVVDRATREGLYVILDLHLTAPKDPKNAVDGVTTQCAVKQNPVPDVDHAVLFWTAIAQQYKSYPNVMFELFNEPYLTQWDNYNGSEEDAWKALRDGAVIDSYIPVWSKGHPWKSAGMQQLLDAVRATGATNVVLTSGMNWAANLKLYLKYKPRDPLNQLAAAWHAYPTFDSKWGSAEYKQPNYGENAYKWVGEIMAAGIPVVVTEYGDRNAPGTKGAPFVSALLPRLDALNISYFGWTFTVSEESDHMLLKDNNGTPSDGYGQYVKQHYLCVAAGNTNCP